MMIIIFFYISLLLCVTGFLFKKGLTGGILSMNFSYLSLFLFIFLVSIKTGNKEAIVALIPFTFLMLFKIILTTKLLSEIMLKGKSDEFMSFNK